MIPDSLSYEFVASNGCVGDGYYICTNNETDKSNPVPYSQQTDEDSVYVLETIDRKGQNNARKYWNFGDGWDHFDDFLYNGAMKIFERIDSDKLYKITVNYGRIHKIDRLSTKLLERSISVLIPSNLTEFDLPGLSGEDSITEEEGPVMFSNIDILDELYWVMTDFSKDHSSFQEMIDGEETNHTVDSDSSLRAYQSIAVSYPYFEGLLTDLIDRIDLKKQDYQGKKDLQFKYYESPMMDCPTKTIINTLEESRNKISKSEKEFLIESFYDESGELGISRNIFSHDILEATRGFQKINWRELSRHLLISIAYLEEKVVCAAHDIYDAADISVFKQWVQEREDAGYSTVN